METAHIINRIVINDGREKKKKKTCDEQIGYNLLQREDYGNLYTVKVFQ